MPDVTSRRARALIAAHGSVAAAVADRAVANFRALNMGERAEEWRRVAAAIKAIQGKPD